VVLAILCIAEILLLLLLFVCFVGRLVDTISICTVVEVADVVEEEKEWNIVIARRGRLLSSLACNLQDRAGSSFLILARFRGRANLVNLANQIVEDLVYVNSLLSRGL